MAKTILARTGLVSWSAGTDPFQRTDMQTSFAALEASAMLGIDGALNARPSPGKAKRIFTCTDAPNLGKQFYDTGVAWVAMGGNTQEAKITATAPANVAATIKGAASQTADLTRWLNDGDVVLAKIDKDGVATFPENVLGGAAAASVTLAKATNRIAAQVKGPNGQAADLQQWLVNDVVQAKINNLGAATFKGVSTTDLVATGEISAANLEVENLSTLEQISIDSDTNSVVPLAIKLPPGQSVPAVTVVNDAAAVLARITQNGMVAGKRLTTDVTYDGLDTIRAKINAANEFGMRVWMAVSQTAAPLVIVNDANITQWSVSPQGDTVTAGRGQFGGGLFNAAPSTVFGGSILPLDVVTGAGAGAYNDAIAFRHSGSHAGVAATRTLALMLKLGGAENTQAESNKWAGIRAWSNTAGSDQVALEIMTAGGRAASFQADNRFTPFGDIQMADGIKLRWGSGVTASRVVWYESGASLYEQGVQGGTFYMRSAGDFYWYNKGEHSASAGSPGSGGLTLMNLQGDPSNPRLNVRRLAISEAIANDDATGSSLSIGSLSGVHFQMSNQTLNVFSSGSNSANAGMSLQIAGGSYLGLGSSTTEIRIGPRTIIMGGNAFTIDYGAPSGPTNGDVWIDIDA